MTGLGDEGGELGVRHLEAHELQRRHRHRPGCFVRPAVGIARFEAAGRIATNSNGASAWPAELGAAITDSTAAATSKPPSRAALSTMRPSPPPPQLANWQPTVRGDAPAAVST